MIFQYPYRAVILGEEYIVKSWRGRKLVTDKGTFTVRHLHGDWQIQTARLLEVASVQFTESGKWLLNGKDFELLNSLPMGIRLGIENDEMLRVHRGKICAVAWIQLKDTDNLTSLLDKILAFWKSASQPAKQDHSIAFHLGEIGKTFFSQSLLQHAWSKPIWLTEFRHNATSVPISSQQKQLAKIAGELHETKSQLQKANAAANNNLKEALSMWMGFDPPRMSADTKARIEKAVKIYTTDPQKRSLSKIAKDFGVSPKTVSLWFKSFTEETGFKVVTHQRHESVRSHLKADWGNDSEE